MKISLIVPIAHAEYLTPFVERVEVIAFNTKSSYEIIFIANQPSVKIQQVISSLALHYPVKLVFNRKKLEKKQIIMQGMQYSKHEIICVIPANLHYPPESISQMLLKIEQGADIVIANRLMRKKSMPEWILHTVLHDTKEDVFSELILFKREILQKVNIFNISDFFTLDFLVKSRLYGYTVLSQDIDYIVGTTVNSIIALHYFWFALRLRLQYLTIVPALRKISPLHLSEKNSYSVARLG